MRLITVYVLVLTMLVLSGGCVTGHKGRTVPDRSTIKPGTTTKRQIYDRYGVPTDVFHTGEKQVLLYERQTTRGMGVKLNASVVPVVSLSHKHQGSDSVIIILDEKGRVESVDEAKQSELAEYHLWPFD